MNNNEQVVFLGIGSNIGNRSEYLRNALARIEELEDVRIEKISSIYETDPVGYLKQNKFLNCVVQLRTKLSPQKLLNEVKEIERDHNRQREIHWGPRTLDLDILFYGNCEISLPGLTIPHPEVYKRRFVMVPLCEISPEFSPNVGDKTICDLLTECKDNAAVEHYAGAEFIR